MAEKWKDVENDSNHVSKNLWVQAEKAAIRSKREILTHIDKIMPRILKQVHKKHDVVKENGDPNIEKIEQLFSQYDSDNEIHQGEIKQFIESLSFGVSLDHNAIFKEIKKDFYKINYHNIVRKNEFVEGFVKWIDKAMKHDPRIKNPKRAIAKFEEDSWAEIDKRVDMENPILSIMYVIFGVGIMYVISGAFMQSIMQFSNEAHMPLDFTSFVVFPIAMNARTVIKSLVQYYSSVSRNASLAFSEVRKL
ncbi:sodium/calcium exchanger NCL2-like [Bidens hawaiensis]|uniref:sodium/calcium exchanger NCL2-like n=1 Tax=Bidens hawaiensis TaxID=980011 RepID=UPI00404AC0AA